MDEKKLQALVRKNAAKAEKTLKKSRGTFDSTLDVTRPPENPNEDETMAIFREMKKREF